MVIYKENCMPFESVCVMHSDMDCKKSMKISSFLSIECLLENDNLGDKVKFRICQKQIYKNIYFRLLKSLKL